MCDYPFFIPQVVLFANSSLFWFKVTNEHREFRNYLIFNFIRHIEFCIFVLRMPTIGTGFLTGSNPFIPTKRAIPETFDYLSHTDSPLPSLNNNFNKYLDFSSIL